MLETTNQSDDQNTQQGGNLQEPRNDLQQGAARQLNESAVPQTTPATQQPDLTQDSLRVGDSAVTVQNTTSTPPNYYLEHNLLNAAWLWLLVPLALAVVLFWPQKKASKSSADPGVAGDPTPAPVQAEDNGSNVTAVSSPKKQQKSKSKKKSKK